MRTLVHLLLIDLLCMLQESTSELYSISKKRTCKARTAVQVIKCLEHTAQWASTHMWLETCTAHIQSLLKILTGQGQIQENI
jgi:hypothetical protein